MFVLINPFLDFLPKKITMKPNSSQLISNSFLLYLLLFTPLYSPSAWGQCNILGDTEVCKSSLGFYEDTANYGGGTITHLWYSNGGGVVSGPFNQSEVQIFWSQPGNWIVYNEVFINGALVDMCTFNVIVDQIQASLSFTQEGHPLLVGESSTKLHYCIGDEITVSVVSSAGSIEYVWDLDGADVNSIVTPNGIEVGFIEFGTVQICATVTNEANCQEVLCTEVEVVDPSGLAFSPFPTSGNPDTLFICKGQTYRFNNNSVPIQNFGYRWTVTYNDHTWTYYTFDKDELIYPFNDPGVYTITLFRNFESTACNYEPASMKVVVAEDMITPILCPTPVCSGEEICYETPFDCSKYNWTISEEGTINGDSTNNTVCVEWTNTPGSTTGALSLDIMNCTEEYCSDPTVVYIPLFPSVVEIYGAEMVCGDSFAPYELTAFNEVTGINYTWSYQIINGSGGVSLDPLDGPNNNLRFQNFTGTILLTVVGMENMGSCSFEASKIITVYNSRIEIESPICFGTDITVELLPASADPIDWFVYDQFHNEVYQSLMTGSSFSIPTSAGLAPGNYTIAVMMPGGFPGACMVDTTFIINDPISPPVINGPSLVCFGDTIIYRSNILGTHEWTITGGQIIGPSSEREVKVLWKKPVGPYILRARRMLGECYSDFAIKEIQVQEFEDLMIMGNTTPCPDNIEPEPYIISFDGATNISWQILPPYSHLGSLVLGDHPDSIGVFWHYAQVNGILLEVTANVCDTTISDTLKIRLQPYSPSYNWPDTLCQHTLAQLEAPEANEYEWYINGNLQEGETSQNLSHVFNGYGIHYITAILTDPGGCSGEYAILDSIFISPAPIASIFLEDPLPCPIGTPFDSIFLETLEYPGFNNVSYSWSHLGLVIGSEHKVMISDTGLYTLVVSIGECVDSSSHFVDYDCDVACPCSPNVEVNIDTLYLLQDSCGLFEIRGTIVPLLTGNVVGARYIFPAPIGVHEIEGISDLDQTHSYDEPGIYHIKLQADWQCDTGGVCMKTDIAALRVPVISEFVWDFSCIGDGDNYMVIVRDASRSIDSLQENEWSGDVSTQTGVEEIQFQAAAGATIEVCLTQTTVGGYSCTNCQMVEVPDAPSADFDISAPGFCLNTEVQMIPSIVPNDDIANVLWDFGDNSISHIDSPIKKYSTNGTYPVSLSVETIFGCNLNATDTFEVVSSTMEGDIVVMGESCNASATLSFNLTDGGPVAEWEWSTGETDSTIVVNTTDVYRLTVTDVNGCTFTPTFKVVQINPPFPNGILGNLMHCSAINLRVSPNGGYIYNWDVTGPGGFTDTKLGSNFYIKPNLNAGTYLVGVTASDTSGICSDTNVTVIIFGNPPKPDVAVDVINCMPSQVVLSSDTILHWTSKPTFLLDINATEVELTNLHGRTIKATFTDSNGCTSDTSILIPQAINFNPIGSGCGETCPDSVLAGAVCLSGISGSFEYWEWRLEGIAIPGASGDSIVQCLLLDTSYLNKYITLLIENGGCEEESPIFYIKKIDCPLPCPDSLSLNWMAGLDGITCINPSIAGEKILYLDFTLFMPDGYEYCGGKPSFEDGYFEEDIITYNGSNGTLHVTGEYHITDISGFNEDYIIRGLLDLCPIGDTTYTCPASFEIAKIDCHNSCASDPCSPGAECTGNIVLLDVDEGIGFYSMCITLPENPPTGDCTYEDYWIHVYQNGDWVVSQQVDTDEIIYYQYCFEFEHPIQLSDSCFYVIVENNCFDEEFCDATICPSETPLQGDPPIKIRSVEKVINLFEILPNPSDGEQVILRYSNQDLKKVMITIIDVRGLQVDHQEITLINGEGKLTTSQLVAGYYVVRITTSDPNSTVDVLSMIILD